MSGPTVHHLIEGFVNQLYFTDIDTETASICRKMKEAIENQSRMLPSAMFSSLTSKLVESGMALINFDSRDIKFKLIGLLVLDGLLDVSDEVMAERRIEIANQLRKVLEFDRYPLESYANVLRSAASSIGHLARVASTTEIEFLQDFYVTNSIKWLSDARSETRRYAGALLISELAINSPALIFAKRKVLFGSIWELIFDRVQIIREVAAAALRSALALVAQREHADEYLRVCLGQIEAGLTSNSPERTHGALLILDCLATKTVITPSDLLQTMRNLQMVFTDLIWTVLQRRDSKEPITRIRIIELIPKLAEVAPGSFLQANNLTPSKNFLTFCVAHLLGLLKQKERASAYIALGDLFVAVSHSPVGLEDVECEIFQAVLSGFKEPFCVEALRCLGKVVKVSINSKRYVNQDFVSSMFNGGLTSDLIAALKEVNKYVTSVRTVVQSRLRQLITDILLTHTIVLEDIGIVTAARTPSVSGSKPPPARRASTASTGSTANSGASAAGGASSGGGGLFRSFFSSDNTSTQSLVAGRQRILANRQYSSQDVSSDDELILALKVLSSFDFIGTKKTIQLQSILGTGGQIADPEEPKKRKECNALLRIVREGVVRYLDDSNPDIRCAAAVTCATVMDKVVKSIELDNSMIECLLQIMNRLVMLGVGDDVASNRISVFRALVPSLDQVLTACDHVNLLIDALNDESFEARTAAMTVLSRVAHFDNVHVMPLVRLLLSKLMQQLQDSKDSQTQLAGVQMLRAMVIGMDTLIIPYINLLLTPLLQLLESPITSIRCEALATIGELSKTSPDDVRPYLSTIFPVIIELLTSDHTSATHLEIAMGSLCNIVAYLSLVSEPYAMFPNLFSALVRILHKADPGSAPSRQLAIKAMGLIGAADAQLYQRFIGSSVRRADTMSVYEDEVSQDARTKAQGDLTMVASNTVEDEDDALLSLDRYYVNVVIRALTNIVKDDSLAMHHQTAVTVAMRIVRFLGSQGISHLDDFVAAVVSRIYSSESASAQEVFIEHIVTLVNVFRAGIIRHLQSIVKIMCDFIGVHLLMCLDLLESVCTLAPPQHYNSALREVLPLIIQIVRNELIQDSDDVVPQVPQSAISAAAAAIGRTVEAQTNSAGVKSILMVTGDGGRKSMPQTRIILQSLANLSPYLREYSLHTIPIIISVAEDKIVIPDVRREALCTVMHIISDVREMQVFAGRIIHPLLRIIDSDKPALQASAFIALSTFVCKLGTGYIPFVVTAKRKLLSIAPKDISLKSSQFVEYEYLVDRLLNQLPLPMDPSDIALNFFKSDVRAKLRADNAKSTPMPMSINMMALETAWTLTGKITMSDLVEWMRRLSIELIRQSPSPIIRPCAVLAKVHQPLAVELFNAAFVSVWSTCFPQNSNAILIDNVPLIFNIETALQSSQIPDNIRQALLNLAEFLEMQDTPLPLEIKLLANQSQSANMFAKCLHYREIEFASVNNTPTKECIEALIAVNKQLGLRDSANGILEVVRSKYSDSISIQPRWLEKLHCWEEARLLYLTQSQVLKQTVKPELSWRSPEWLSNELGMLRCLRALGEHAQLNEKVTSLFNYMRQPEVLSASDPEESYENLVEIQRLGAHSAWMLGRWDEMDSFLGDSVAKNASSGLATRKHRHSTDLENNITFYHTVMAIQKQKYSKALNLIEETRTELGASLSSLMNESYSRAYRAIVSMQLLTELEEVVKFKDYAAKTIASSTTAPPSIDPSLGLVVNIPKEVAEELTLKKATLVKTWRERFRCAPREVDVYREILHVHGLLIEPAENLDSWLELVTLSRKHDMLGVCENVLRFLGAPLGPRSEEWSKDWRHPTQNRHPKLMYHMYKFLWSKGEKGKALSGLADFLSEIPNVPTDPETRSMKVKCLVKKAEWTRSLMDHGSEGSEVKLKEVMEMVRQARDMASDQYAVWHAWAVTNYDQLQLAEAQLAKLKAQIPEASFVDLNKSYSSISRDDLTGVLANRGHRRSKSNSIIRFDPALDAIASVESASNTLIVESIKGFVRSIMLSKDQEVANVLQDTLRLLTLWFSYGTRQNVYYVLSNELDHVQAENWLAVIPQLIARMHVRVPEIADLLRQVLLKVSAAHPQALVCPIYVALNTTDVQRKNLAEDIIASIRRTDSQLVDEAMLVSKELMRVAITAHEVWHEGLERAAHLYIVEKDVQGMLEVLMQLHGHEQSVHLADDNILKGGKGASGSEGPSPATLRDVSFYNSFGRELAKAQEWLLKFQESSSNLMFLHQAWAIYHEVFKKIATQLKQLKHLELAHVSPALTSATGLVLAVPGTYKPFRDIVRISKFAASVDVISSKQRPRRMTITGCNGSKYRFLLKGHEDLRQDERVMQLFGLVNACLQQKRSTNQLQLKIVRYSVLPLSNNSGLIGWVENCDTLNQLVKSYRESVNIKLNVEHRMLMSKAPQYDKLPLIHKMSAFQEVLDETQGLDIQKMLWLKSRTSDMWIERRTNFTKSLAVTSMTGYILGLGDRHPSNLMLDRVTGKIVHIDFGDCFEVAMNRSKFPETVPFRLTRMLINAMEISGIEGTYRSTCQRVMGLIRDNRDSVMAMLEAFVYDPLISWRLVASSNSAPETHGVGGTTTPGAVADTVDEIVVHLSNSVDSHRAIENAVDGDVTVDSDGRALDGISTFKETASEVGAASTKEGGKHAMQTRLKKNWEQQDDAERDLDTLNSKAMEVILRIQSKLTGRDFSSSSYVASNAMKSSASPQNGSKPASTSTSAATTNAAGTTTTTTTATAAAAATGGSTKPATVGPSIGEELSVDEQVDRLIQEAISVENLAQLFVGWCPFW